MGKAAGLFGKKLIEYTEALNNKQPCRVCKEFAKRRNEEPDCENCLPYLEPENRDAINVLLLSGGQAGDMNVVLRLLDIVEASDPVATIQKVQTIINHYKPVRA